MSSARSDSLPAVPASTAHMANTRLSALAALDAALALTQSIQYTPAGDTGVRTGLYEAHARVTHRAREAVDSLTDEVRAMMLAGTAELWAMATQLAGEPALNLAECRIAAARRLEDLAHEALHIVRTECPDHADLFDHTQMLRVRNHKRAAGIADIVHRAHEHVISLLDLAGVYAEKGAIIISLQHSEGVPDFDIQAPAQLPRAGEKQKRAKGDALYAVRAAENARKTVLRYIDETLGEVREACDMMAEIAGTLAGVAQEVPTTRRSKRERRHPDRFIGSMDGETHASGRMDLMEVMLRTGRARRGEDGVLHLLDDNGREIHEEDDDDSTASGAFSEEDEDEVEHDDDYDTDEDGSVSSGEEPPPSDNESSVAAAGEDEECTDSEADSTVGMDC